MELIDIKKTMKLIGQAIIDRSDNLPNIYLSDEIYLGNDIGKVIGEIHKMDADEADMLLGGIRHGISLTNGTH